MSKSKLGYSENALCVRFNFLFRKWKLKKKKLYLRGSTFFKSSRSELFCEKVVQKNC